MKPVLIGSQALLYYGLLKGRVPSDWDFIMEKEKSFYKTPKGNFDISDANSLLEKTNRIIFEKSQMGPKVITPMGEAVVIPLNLLKVMKLSSLPLNKVKNSFDLKYLEHVSLNEEDLVLLKNRTLETESKLIAKREFFNKYKIRRFFDHDYLHLLINPTPTYLKALGENGVEILEEKFNLLPDAEKVLIFWEECFVLSLERYLIINVRKYPMLVDSYCDKFFKTEKSSDPSIYWLNRLCAVGLVKDHPDWLGQWGQDNYEMILSGFSLWWDQTFDSLPEDFWKKLLMFDQLS